MCCVRGIWYTIGIMAFNNFVKRFITPNAEHGEQEKNLFSTLDKPTQVELDEIKYAYKQTGGFTGDQIAFLSGVREKVEATHGEEAYKEALSAYMKSEAPSRLGELRDVMDRNNFLKQGLMKAMADFDRAGTTDTVAALDRAKSSLKVLKPDTFSRFDVEAYCSELKDSEEFELFIRERVMAAPANPAVIEQPTIIPEAVAALPEKEAEEVSKVPFELRPPSTPLHKVIREAGDISGLTPEVAALHKKSADSGKTTGAV